jgi:hypothetical protein
MRISASVSRLEGEEEEEEENEEEECVSGEREGGREGGREGERVFQAVRPSQSAALFARSGGLLSIPGHALDHYTHRLTQCGRARYRRGYHTTSTSTGTGTSVRGICDMRV